MSTTKPAPKVAYRSAETGQFTTKRAAERRPATHVREVMRPAPKKR